MNSVAKILSDLLNFTSTMCKDCYREMPYNTTRNKYVCEICANCYDFNAKDEYLVFEWKEFKEYISLHKTPKLVIKVFLTKLWLQKDYDEQFIDELLQEVREKGTFKGI
jgi:hypothetical protein